MHLYQETLLARGLGDSQAQVGTAGRALTGVCCRMKPSRARLDLINKKQKTEIWTEKQGDSLSEYSTVMLFLNSHKREYSYWCLRVVVANDHKLGGFKQQNFVLPRFWRPEVLEQGVGRVGLKLQALGENLCLASLLWQFAGNPRGSWWGADPSGLGLHLHAAFVLRSAPVSLFSSQGRQLYFSRTS